ncbi:hypothetical protein [Kitasatospora arboriphila]|uniref:Uncharacterized protein n=1 Tax=Kitasatospora arboriphila TaxID=258052 RepID=A0ABN1U3A0_9ACTN
MCGLDQGFDPWGSDGLTPSFAICGCCFIEFGYEDASNAGIMTARAGWIEAGCPWRGSVSERPAGWDPRVQLVDSLKLS